MCSFWDKYINLLEQNQHILITLYCSKNVKDRHSLKMKSPKVFPIFNFNFIIHRNQLCQGCLALIHHLTMLPCLPCISGGEM